MALRTIAVASLALAACNLPDLDEAIDTYNAHRTTGGDTETPSDESGGEATSGASDINTVTSAATTDSPSTTVDSSSTGEPADAPPVIEALTVDPATRSEAGPVYVTLEHSANAAYITVEARAEIQGELKTVLLVSDEADAITWPIEFAITSQEGFNGDWTIHARVENEHGADEAQAALAVELPPGGLEVWTQEIEGPGSFMYARGVAAHPDGAAVLVQNDLIGGTMGLVRLHDALTGVVIWESESIQDFDPRGVAVYEDGRILAVGTDVDLGRARSFTFDPDVGAGPIDSWTAGTVSNEARAVSMTADGSFVIAGVEHKDGHDDVIVWSFLTGEMPAVVRWGGPFPVEKRDEVAQAVFLDDERILVAGVAMLKSIENFKQPRTIVLEYTRDLVLDRWWSHAGGEAFQTSEGRGVSGDSFGGAIVVGSTRLEEDAPPYVAAVQLAPQGNNYGDIAHPLSDVLGFATGVTLDPSGRSVVVLTNGVTSPTTVEIAAFDLMAGVVSWKAGYEHTQSKAMESAAIAVDPYGFIYYVASVIYEGSARVVAGKKRP